MSFSLYQASIPAFINGLKNLSAILTKAKDYAEAKKINQEALIAASQMTYKNARTWRNR